MKPAPAKLLLLLALFPLAVARAESVTITGAEWMTRKGA